MSRRGCTGSRRAALWLFVLGSSVALRASSGTANPVGVLAGSDAPTGPTGFGVRRSRCALPPERRILSGAQETQTRNGRPMHAVPVSRHCSHRTLRRSSAGRVNSVPQALQQRNTFPYRTLARRRRCTGARTLSGSPTRRSGCREARWERGRPSFDRRPWDGRRSLRSCGRSRARRGPRSVRPTAVRFTRAIGTTAMAAWSTL